MTFLEAVRVNVIEGQAKAVAAGVDPVLAEATGPGTIGHQTPIAMTAMSRTNTLCQAC